MTTKETSAPAPSASAATAVSAPAPSVPIVVADVHDRRPPQRGAMAEEDYVRLEKIQDSVRFREEREATTGPGHRAAELVRAWGNLLTAVSRASPPDAALFIGHESMGTFLAPWFKLTHKNKFFSFKKPYYLLLPKGDTNGNRGRFGFELEQGMLAFAKAEFPTGSDHTLLDQHLKPLTHWISGGYVNSESREHEPILSVKSPADLGCIIKDKKLVGLQAFLKAVARAAYRIGWDDGAAPWTAMNWVDAPPSYNLRAGHYLALLDRAKSRKICPPLYIARIPVYVPVAGAKNGEIHWRTCVRNGQAVILTGADAATSALHDAIAGTGRSWWTTIDGEARADASSIAKFAIYCLMVCDYEAPPEFRWQAYVGKATSGVTARWFGTGWSSHATAIRSVYSDVTRSFKSALLCETLLALNYARRDSFEAHLFVLRNMPDRAAMEEAEKTIIKAFGSHVSSRGLNKPIKEREEEEGEEEEAEQ